MNMNKYCIALLVMALPVAGQAEIYKWKDSNGVIRYSDVPPNNKPYESMATRKTAPATSDTPTGEQQPYVGNTPQVNREIAAERRREEAEQSKKESQEKAAAEKTRLENCNQAKANLANYQQGGRVYKMNADGEREYLDDDALEKSAAEAQKQVNKYCG